MANIIITMKIMPDDPSIDIASVESSVKKEIEDFAGETEFKVQIEPIAFGIKALKISFVMDESKGSTDKLEKAIIDIPEVGSVDVTDVRRAIG